MNFGAWNRVPVVFKLIITGNTWDRNLWPVSYQIYFKLIYTFRVRHYYDTLFSNCHLVIDRNNLYNIFDDFVSYSKFFLKSSATSRPLSHNAWVLSLMTCQKVVLSGCRRSSMNIPFVSHWRAMLLGMWTWMWLTVLWFVTIDINKTLIAYCTGSLHQTGDGYLQPPFWNRCNKMINKLTMYLTRSGENTPLYLPTST